MYACYLIHADQHPKAVDHCRPVYVNSYTPGGSSNQPCDAFWVQSSPYFWCEGEEALLVDQSRKLNKHTMSSGHSSPSE